MFIFMYLALKYASYKFFQFENNAAYTPLAIAIMSATRIHKLLPLAENVFHNTLFVKCSIIINHKYTHDAA